MWHLKPGLKEKRPARNWDQYQGLVRREIYPMARRASVGYEKVTLPRLALIKVGFIFICSLDLSRLYEHPFGRVASFLFMPYLLIFVLIRMFASLMLWYASQFINGNCEACQQQASTSRTPNPTNSKWVKRRNNPETGRLRKSWSLLQQQFLLSDEIPIVLGMTFLVLKPILIYPNQTKFPEPEPSVLPYG